MAKIQKRRDYNTIMKSVRFNREWVQLLNQLARDHSKSTMVSASDLIRMAVYEKWIEPLTENAPSEGK